MKNFNLLQIVPTLNSGGVEQGTIDLANFLGEKKMGSFIISNGGSMQTHLNSRNVHHIKIPVHSKNFLLMPIIAKKIKKIINENKINVVHVRSRAPAWMLQFIHDRSFKLVSTFHNVYGTQNFLKKIYNKSMSKVDHIIANSEYVKSQISEVYKIKANKITVINRGVDTKFFDPSVIQHAELADFISKFDIPGDSKIILYPGRLTEWKGQINFLNIIKHYKDKKIICYFVGDDKNQPYYSKLINAIKKNNIEENCKVLGHLSNMEMKMFYKCADVVVSAPIKPEGFGRIISESLAMKKVLICYDYGGAKEQLSSLNSLFKVAPNDQNEMRNKIEKAFTFSKKYRQEIGVISRLHIINKFSKEKMLSDYLNFYQNII